MDNKNFNFLFTATHKKLKMENNVDGGKNGCFVCFLVFIVLVSIFPESTPL